MEALERQPLRREQKAMSAPAPQVVLSSSISPSPPPPCSVNPVKYNNAFSGPGRFYEMSGSYSAEVQGLMFLDQV